ncbi:MAG: hypothetical protein ABSG16_21580 [Candidatus Acidiferrum sp.]
MADIKITDDFGLSVDLQVRDDSPLGKAKLSQLLPVGKEFFAQFNKPLDQADVKSMSFGPTVTSPDLLSGDPPTLTVGGGVSCGINIHNAADALLPCLVSVLSYILYLTWV